MKRFIAVVAVVLLFASVGWADSGYITSSGLSLKKLVEISKEIIDQVEKGGQGKVKFVNMVVCDELLGGKAYLFFEGKKEFLQGIKNPKMNMLDKIDLTVGIFYKFSARLRDYSTYSDTVSHTFETATELFQFMEQYKILSGDFLYKPYTSKFYPVRHIGMYFLPKHNLTISRLFSGLKIKILDKSFK